MPYPVILRPSGEKIILWGGLKTREAAHFLGCSMRHVQSMCDEGILQEGTEWRRLPGRRSREGKVYRIKIEAIERLSGRKLHPEPSIGW